jgi:hypothetical protein
VTDGLAVCRGPAAGTARNRDDPGRSARTERRVRASCLTIAAPASTPGVPGGGAVPSRLARR